MPWPAIFARKPTYQLIMRSTLSTLLRWMRRIPWPPTAANCVINNRLLVSNFCHWLPAVGRPKCGNSSAQIISFNWIWERERTDLSVCTSGFWIRNVLIILIEVGNSNYYAVASKTVPGFQDPDIRRIWRLRKYITSYFNEKLLYLHFGF